MKKTSTCEQCEHPDLKGLHTCEKRRRPDSAKQLLDREEDLTDELVSKHGYMFQELRHKNDRSTMQFVHDKKTGKSIVSPAVCIKLIVPADSWLGTRIINMRKAKGKKA